MHDLSFVKAVSYWMQWAITTQEGSDLSDVTNYEDYLVLQIKMPVDGSEEAVNRQLLNMYMETISNYSGLREDSRIWQVIETNLKLGTELDKLVSAGAQWPDLSNPMEVLMLRADCSWQTEPWRFGLPNEWRESSSNSEDSRIPWVDNLL